MILQPLFENAVKHGVYESLEPVNIRLHCRRERGYVVINLINDFDPGIPPSTGEQIGLRNIENRLEMIYNRRNLLKIEKSENSFSVEISIPIPAEK